MADETNKENTTPPVHLYAAMLKAQASLETVRKNGENPHFRSKYATLDEMWETVRKPINDAGLVVYCTIAPEAERWVLTTHLAEAKTGEEVTCQFPVAVAGSTPQAIGSALTYARRYTLGALLQIVTGDGADDDGEAATTATQRPTHASPQQARPAARPATTAQQRPATTVSRPAPLANNSLGF